MSEAPSSSLDTSVRGFGCQRDRLVQRHGSALRSRYTADPIGRRMRGGFNSQTSREIVGVVADESHTGLGRAPTFNIYVPYSQVNWTGGMSYIVRTTVDENTALAGVRQALRGLNVADNGRDMQAEVNELRRGLKEALGPNAPVIDRVNRLGERMVDTAQALAQNTEEQEKLGDRIKDLKDQRRALEQTVAGNFRSDPFEAGIASFDFMTATDTSNVAGSVGGGSGWGRATLNAARSSGRATSSHVPRTSRAFTGRSTEPRRGRPRVGSARLGGAIAPASVGNAAAISSIRPWRTPRPSSSSTTRTPFRSS